MHRCRFEFYVVSVATEEHRGEIVMATLQQYLPPSLLMDEDAPERWIFLDYEVYALWRGNNSKRSIDPTLKIKARCAAHSAAS
jgi:hypothetical protein